MAWVELSKVKTAPPLPELQTYVSPGLVSWKAGHLLTTPPRSLMVEDLPVERREVGRGGWKNTQAMAPKVPTQYAC